MIHAGNLRKMVSIQGDPIQYALPLGDSLVNLNDHIGSSIKLHFNGTINCVCCGKKIKKTYNQGFCFQCFQTAPEADESIVKPELSKVHLGIARDLNWAQTHDLIDHYVYIAVSSDLKIGVTRHHQIPTRWIDQGASYAIKVAKVPNRHVAGIMEVWFKKYYKDKTNWRAMLTNQVNNSFDLKEEKYRALELLPAELKQYSSDDDSVTVLNYPVEEFPTKINSLSLDKENTIEKKLIGIKGQYLLFEGGDVLNIRKHNGYFVEIEY
ncbi:DUF2797 domain-containing protein [Puteibacter caeruleilacunae]|nr:DUF2797 domain-containing protein [Puteibacter caeruleilacunae]